MVNPHYLIQRLTTAQAARYSGYHADTIKKALAAGSLHGTQRCKGGRWLVDPRCLESWLAGEECFHRTGAPPGPHSVAYLPPDVNVL